MVSDNVCINNKAEFNIKKIYISESLFPDINNSEVLQYFRNVRHNFISLRYFCRGQDNDPHWTSLPDTFWYIFLTWYYSPDLPLFGAWPQKPQF